MSVPWAIRLNVPGWRNPPTVSARSFRAEDTTPLRSLLDDKFIATFDTGTPLDKAHFVPWVIAGAQDRTRTQTVTGRVVTIDGDTAIVVGNDRLAGTADGKSYAVPTRVTAVHIRGATKWRALALHIVTPRSAGQRALANGRPT